MCGSTNRLLPRTRVVLLRFPSNLLQGATSLSSALSSSEHVLLVQTAPSSKSLENLGQDLSQNRKDRNVWPTRRLPTATRQHQHPSCRFSISERAYAFFTLYCTTGLSGPSSISHGGCIVFAFSQSFCLPTTYWLQRDRLHALSLSVSNCTTGISSPCESSNSDCPAARGFVHPFCLPTAYWLECDWLRALSRLSSNCATGISGTCTSSRHANAILSTSARQLSSRLPTTHWFQHHWIYAFSPCPSI